MLCNTAAAGMQLGAGLSFLMCLGLGYFSESGRYVLMLGVEGT